MKVIWHFCHSKYPSAFNIIVSTVKNEMGNIQLTDDI